MGDVTSVFPRTMAVRQRTVQPVQVQQPAIDEEQAYDALIKQAQDRLDALQNRPARYTPEEVAQRQDQNQREYELGLAGMMSGSEALGGVGGAIFKNALAMRQPKSTDHGTLDQISGQFTYNPEYLQEQAQNKLATYTQLKAAAQAKRATQAREDQNRADLQGQRYEMMAAIKGMGAGAAGGAQEARNWRGEDVLRTDFERQTKPLTDQLLETQKVKELIAGYSGRRMDPVSQGAVVILLNKFLDPGSVVREGEYDRIVKQQGLLGQAQLLTDRIMNGAVLTPQTIQQINNLASLYEQAATKKILYHANNFSTVASRRGLDAGNVIVDPRYRPGQRPAAPVAGGGGGGGGAVDFGSLPP